jgi:hypothetical protein
VRQQDIVAVNAIADHLTLVAVAKIEKLRESLDMEDLLRSLSLAIMLQ